MEVKTEADSNITECRHYDMPITGIYVCSLIPVTDEQIQFFCVPLLPFLSHSASLAQNTSLMMSHSLLHLPPAHHSHPPSHIHCSIPGSKLTFSTNLFHHSLLAPTWTAFTDILDWTYSAQRFFIFSYFFIFYFGHAID